MAGAIEKEINQIRQQLVGTPLTHIDARAAILSDIALSREFSNTFLQALCLGHTGGKDESGSTATMALHVISKALAKQRMICYGAHTISTTYKKFALPSHESVNGALTLTEANTSFFGYVAKDLTETNTITLSNSTTANQTIDGNTFSTYVGDYYMVRSRVSGELEITSGNVSAYSTPDGGDIVFGNSIAWGSSVAGEQTANTWNYHWARANIASVAIQNSGAVTELSTLTLSDNLTQGSNTDYTPVGPGFNQKFYLKRHADSVNTFAITGTTTTGSVVVTAISETDIVKIKYNDVVSGTGIDGAPTIAAVQAANSQLRMSNAATANGTVTITVNSVPFGHAAHDIFCQVEVSGEGLVANSTWTPVGDDAGTYPSASEDDLCVANTSQFIALLGFFNPGNASSSDLVKGASGLYSSTGKAYGARAGVGNYRMLLEDGSTTSASTDNVSTEGFLLFDSTDGSADAGDNILTEEHVTAVGAPVEDTGYSSGVEDNPFKPANQGTTTAFALKEGEMSGTQPDGLTNKDVYVGRFVSWNKDRTKMSGTASVADHEYRYITDSAEKFFYAPGRGATYRCGSVTEVAGENLPGVGGAGSEAEPRAVLPRTGLASCVTLIRADETLAGSTNATSNWTVPADDAIHTSTANSTSGSVPATDTSYTYRVSSGVIKRGGYTTVYSGPTANSTGGDDPPLTVGFTSPGRTVITPVDYAIVSNYVSRKLTTDGSTANADVAFVESVIDSLQSVAEFRDPVATGNIANPGFTDAAFDTYICATTGTNAVDAALSTVETSLAAFYTAAGMSSRSDGTFSTGFGGGSGQNVGTAVNCASFSSDNTHGKWVSFSTACGTLVTNLDNRIAEIDARIGVPVYGNSTSTGTTPATRGNPPCIRVKTIPAANTTSGYVPYGRAIYDNVNLLLGQDVDLLGGIMKDIESLTDLVQLVKNARNKYEIYNGRAKEY
jgi:hypothetical protein